MEFKYLAQSHQAVVVGHPDWGPNPFDDKYGFSQPNQLSLADKIKIQDLSTINISSK